MDLALLIKQRSTELGLGQKDLAIAAQVTESYISQLLGRKKAPPAPGRTDIYARLGPLLQLGDGELERLADLQRRLELGKPAQLAPPEPLFEDCRSLIVRKCDPERRKEILRIFEKEPFGEMERLITQTILDLGQSVAREELRSEDWLRSIAQLSGRSYEQMWVAMLEFLDTDIYHVSRDSCVSFLDPMIESWDIEMRTFRMEVVLNRRLSPRSVRQFEFTERSPAPGLPMEPGLESFLNNSLMSGDATEEEIAFLRSLRFPERRPSALYYYRELQSLRDPLHFSEAVRPPGGGTERT